MLSGRSIHSGEDRVGLEKALDSVSNVSLDRLSVPDLVHSSDRSQLWQVRNQRNKML